MPIIGTIWHTFTPDFDGIYYFSTEKDDDPGEYFQHSVWEGTSLTNIRPVPGYLLSHETGYETDNPRVLRKDTEYRIRVELLTGESWGPYTLDIVAYPDYEDWASSTAGYDSTTGTAGYDSLNDQVTASGGVGYATVEPWRDLANDPQNAGSRWINIRFKMRVTEGRVMFRHGYENALGVLRVNLGAGGGMGLAVMGNLDGTNSLAVYDPGSGPFGGDGMNLFCHFGEGERSFNEWVDVEFNLTSWFNLGAHYGSGGYSFAVAVNGVIKTDGFHPFYYESFHPQYIPNTVEVGAFVYPSGFGSSQEPHDDWEIQIKDLVIRNRPTLGSLPPTDVADMGITHFDGWEHEDKLDNVTGVSTTIVDAPGTPPGNATWWKAVRITGANPSGEINHSWMSRPRPWAGFWLYIDELPDFDNDTKMVRIAQFGGTSEAFGVLTLTRSGELRIIPALTPRTWKSYCVSRLQTQTWYWIEMEVDAGVIWDTTVQIWINGYAMGTFGGSLSLGELEGMTPFFRPEDYQRFAPVRFPHSFTAGVLGTFTVQQSFASWAPGSFSFDLDIYFAHVCTGRAVPFPQGALQTKLFEGHDGDGDHFFPELPDPEDYTHLHTDARPKIWTLYDYVLENDQDPTVVGSNFFYADHPNPDAGTVSIVADGSGPAEIAAFSNAVLWTARTPLNDGAFGAEHHPSFGFADRTWYTTAEGGDSGNIWVAAAWVKGVAGSWEFTYESHPGGAPENSGVDRTTIDGTYRQAWLSAYPAWTGSMISASSWLKMRWYPTLALQEARWKRPMMMRNPLVYPRFALSSDAGATWTMLEDPTVSNTSDNLGQDVAVSSNEAVWMNNSSAIKRIQEFRETIGFPFGGTPMASVGYQATEWYLEYLAPPSIEIEEAEEFSGTRGYNLHLRHGGYNHTPSTSRAAGDLYVTLWDGTHRAPHHYVTASATDIHRVRYPTDNSGGHWTTDIFDDIVMRFGYYRDIGSGSNPNAAMDTNPISWHSTQFKGAYLEALQWEVLSQAAPGPRAPTCGRPQIYRLVTYQGRN